jgi:hypothetical protein
VVVCVLVRFREMSAEGQSLNLKLKFFLYTNFNKKGEKEIELTVQYGATRFSAISMKKCSINLHSSDTLPIRPELYNNAA